MYAQTVHRPPERVNTLVRMKPTETSGARLKAFIEAHWGRSRGGMEGLAQAARLRGRQTLYEWFSGAEPSLASLQQVADALEVRRVDLVAAYDGVIAPEQQETPRPRWAEGLANEIADQVIARIAAVDSPLVGRLEARLEQLGLLPVVDPNEESPAPPVASGTAQPRSR